MRWNLLLIALLLVLALPIAHGFRTINRSRRYFHQTHDAIRIGMGIKDVPIFGVDAPDGARYDLAMCTAGGKDLMLKRDAWRSLQTSDGPFPPACRTIHLWIVGESFFVREKAVFTVNFDNAWTVSNVGEMEILD